MAQKSKINVGGLDFEWDLSQGRFLFEGQNSVLFWTSSAMKMFFDSIEEISGEEAAAVVLESTGFRQGQVVGDYFHDMGGISVFKASELITNTYASAGWGLASIRKLDVEAGTLEVALKNSWEYQINLAQGKKTGGSFLPAHYAGIFSSLLGRNIWYEVVHSQIEGHEECLIRYFPSEETIEKNIHFLARQKESEKIRELEQLPGNRRADVAAR